MKTDIHHNFLLKNVYIVTKYKPIINHLTTGKSNSSAFKIDNIIIEKITGNERKVSDKTHDTGSVH